MHRTAFVVILAIGCVPSSPGGKSTAAISNREADADQRLVILQLLKDDITDMFRRARPEEVCFVSFGEIEKNGVPSRTDPPPEYLQSLQQVRPNTVAGSACELRDNGYFDKITGKAGILISVDFEWEKHKSEVVVSLGFRRNGLDGFGQSVRVAREGSGWVVKQYLRMWVS